MPPPRLTTAPSATVQAITGFDSFAAAGQPACVANNSALVGYMAHSHPLVPVRVLPTRSTSTLLDEVLAGTCAGATVNELTARYALTTADPTGRLW